MRQSKHHSYRDPMVANNLMNEPRARECFLHSGKIGFFLWLVFQAVAAQGAWACPIDVTAATSRETVSGPVPVSVQISGDQVSQIELWVDGNYQASSSSRPFTFTWDSTAYASGNHRITAVAYGSAGNRSCSATTVVNVSNPPVTVILPTTGSIVSGTVGVTTKITQEVGRINLMVDGKYVASPDYNFSFDTTQFPDGPHTISIEAVRNSGVYLGSASVVMIFANRSAVQCLTAGGYQGPEIFATSEIYDLRKQLFNKSAAMQSPRTGHSATRLLNGQVLMAGGFVSTEGDITDSAELFDSVIGAFSSTGAMASSRVYHTATLLSNGTVLMAGGYDHSFRIVPSAELFDPAVGTFTATGDMTSPRMSHEAVLLPNQMVLVSGGIVGGTISSSAELYDPVSGTFATTGGMISPRIAHTMTVLKNNEVLVTGGAGNTAELYDPGLGEFIPTGTMNVARQWAHTATLLLNGKVLIAGGIDGNNRPTATAELYDPDSGIFLPTGSMAAARAGHTATLLTDGTVLIVGGGGGAEIYQPDSETFVSVSDPVYSPTGGQSSTLVAPGPTQAE